ncbi:MAG TPA: PilT/PilU family type 4a pilus ATPase, partial [Candidatus Paceibacterota bacterium]|nr:PilT/PilU family type 4a pilus ATPase [Candidatus Paceibacterota bacterium]
MNYQTLINELLENLLAQDGSDLHLGEGRQPAIRINGQLIFLANYKPFDKAIILGILDILVGKEKLENLEKERSIDFSASLKDNEIQIRGNAFYQRGLICVAIRLLPKPKTIEELNLPTILKDFTRKKQGFFLVVGPVGQGKSTTLSAMINTINQESSQHILTIEDPIEILYKADKSIINQREIGSDAPDFPQALKAAFREDVNVLMIGEMRDSETMAAAVTAAETGHLVFATLHTNNASQSIDRIIDSFPANQQGQIRLQLASSLLGIFSQRLIPRISGGRIPAY